MDTTAQLAVEKQDFSTGGIKHKRGFCAGASNSDLVLELEDKRQSKSVIARIGLKVKLSGAASVP